ncbi:phosphatidylglycerol lysyltransferase domain-containing protein [Paenibacillus thermotolerans]|uniref:phosphatidylglycerol lysyltransferase domain-containing protein n=1 Tax=Paenibacillus thermotolerans TaxID=3027807 RepID=UPI0023681E5F|nr:MULTISPECIES: phosphatidylglycerol lysyltransferase domain-containing protein [unclassified Paenibacillus]
MSNKDVTLGGRTFQRLTLSDKELFSKYFKETEYPTTFYFSNFDIIWGNSGFRDIALWKEMDGMLVVFNYNRRSKSLSLPVLPLGKGSPDHISNVLVKALTLCREWNKGNNMAFVRGIDDLQYEFLRLSTMFRNHIRHKVLPGLERHISVQNTVALPGKAYNDVRYARNKFYRKFPNALVRPVKDEDYMPLLELKKEWNRTAGTKYKKVWDDYFYQKILKYHKQLNHLILVIEIDGKLIAMATGGFTPSGQGWAGILKCLNEYEGASTVMYIEFAKEFHRLNPRAELINIGTDAGVRNKDGTSGLSIFKSKFRPVLSTKRIRLYLRRGSPGLKSEAEEHTP